ncbi:hypothetical protein [Brachybacterium sp. AOP35-5H-19]|uniref:hypothetical protein n=1 Tax=Brachybacterium sp. AOP35-5H-19 TaxID=3457685 RepID=UPI0040339516
MSGTRKYLDRDRTIALEGRPYEVDWVTLLGAGRSAVQRGRADEVPLLSEVIWEDMDSAVVTPRPAALDYALMRRWLDVDESAAMTYLLDAWRGSMNAPEPDTPDGVRAILNQRSCPPKKEWQHFMYIVKRRFQDGPREWYVGYCNDCLEALLMLDDDRTNEIRTWTFYDQEMA